MNAKEPQNITAVQPFPSDWRIALVLVPHPDDPEYGVGAAVAKWTSAGKTVHYALASRGEVGIAGIAAEEAGPLREGEQRASAAIVGVDDVQFWDFPDSNIRNTPELRAKIADTIVALRPDVVITLYSGPSWAPGAPNQRDHIEFAHAVAAAFDDISGRLTDAPRWLFENGPDPTHCEVVDGYTEVAVNSLAAHEVYLSVLDPETPVVEQARRQVEMSTPAMSGIGERTVGFILKRHR
ncbi:PIG-L deacetylase family protein [Mycolicibacterium sp. 050232]|uniref:PIG-L deacetylase family protein n=1 Tax=Mycolicibacterium sp. 050232 TaxID=3113982 RepID=UPI002E28BDE1|nr:PIG-L deacetylase family protein [Mycolicibacterium sp. 050232]MED5812246.1 PIG-L deacetylase family protein [Mycolicibacterium sp. 050232]